MLGTGRLSEARLPASAEGLFITVKTVETHLTRAYRKLGAHSKVQLVRALDELTDRTG